MRMIVILIRVW